jgi:transposase
MTNSISESKKAAIRETRAATKAKRKNQTCRVIELKINESALSNSIKEHLNMYFVEAKWLWNHIIGDNLIHNPIINKPFYKVPVHYTDNTGAVTIKIKDLKYLPAQCKQSIIAQIQGNLKSLDTKERNGENVGEIKCKSDFKSIEFKQFNHTHKIKGNRIKLVGIKRPLKVHGLDQLDLSYMEPANARLVKRASGLYILLTVWVNNEFAHLRPMKGGHKEKAIPTNNAVGIDMGIKCSLVTSNGEAVHIRISEPDRIKHLKRRKARLLRLNNAKRSNNVNKIDHLIRKEFEHMVNRKKDIVNKAICYLTSTYDNIVIQDENIRSWHKGLFGKQVQQSALGSLKAALKNSGATVVKRFVPTTKECYVCGQLTNTVLGSSIFKCHSCGHTEERDIKAAKTILQKGNIGVNPSSTPMMQVTHIDLNKPILVKHFIPVVSSYDTSSGTDE